MPSKRQQPRRPVLAEQVGLPLRPFFYTIDQLAALLSMREKGIRDLLHYEGRSPGVRPADQLHSVNIAPDGLPPDWRVAEQELIRWMRRKGLHYYERGWVS